MPYLPKEIQHWLNREIGPIDSFQTIGGGCINYTGSVITKNVTFFIKWNSAKEFPQIFNKEAKGLKLLKKGMLRVPEVKNIYEGQEFSCLLLENIEPQRRSTNYWHQLGEGLAAQHRITAQSHGLNIDNYMGSLTQHNQTLDNWIDFYIANRLTPQVQLAESKKLIDAETTKSFDRLYTRLSDLINNDPPSLLHGDLWNGNIMVDEKGQPVLIDPAVYYGSREVDLAMTRLFGGFDSDFYDAYNSNYPLLSNIESRIDIYNLYPLLIHLNLFGRGYLGQILSTLNRFG